ncbi:PREDICTED: protein toll-like [Nicrophorus vespilloides]|uniref:Protein toll-like n=1 Tax=Nicrophorus vespilloides TaxID=110193 RepID=A0ABM1M830_NICVS|nr:PREDICTED: protein toll-like [Nicrophorus vespilloides]
MGVSQDVNIFLQRNMITVINLTLAERLIKFEEQYENNKVTLYVDDNPLICDCKNYDLFRYFNLSIDPMVQIVIQIKASELVCSGPPNFVDIKACDVKPHMVTCNVEECPSPCDCAYQPYKSRYIIDCTSRNLSSVPELLAEKSSIYDYKSTAVYLQNNSLKEGPRKGLGYEGINVLNLANNNIRRLKWIPNNLDELNVEGNNISSLEPSILGKLNFTKAFLRNNPWSCECSAINFLHYLKDYVIPFKGDIRCAVDGKQIVTLKDKDICWWHEMMITLLIILAVIFITVPSIMMGIYYKYNQEIKVWLYAHNLCLWFVTDEDLDKDKKYDAFISYSHVDEAFVVEELVSKLEDGPNPYKLCIHVRDWIPGEIITTQVTQSVENSRRTIIVLSPNFLNSVWGKLEFRTAHTQAIQEGRTRVIIILLGDIDLNSNLDEELKAYLKTNTYIKWGDRWFWDKLRFALPHNPNKRSNRKFENISVKIDKMDLMRGSMLPNPGTTPPVDPLLSKLNPLQFKSADDAMVTPPAESGANHIYTDDKLNRKGRSAKFKFRYKQLFITTDSKIKILLGFKHRIPNKQLRRNRFQVKMIKILSFLVCLLVLTTAQKACKQLNTTCTCHATAPGTIQLECPSEYTKYGELEYYDRKVKVDCILWTVNNEFIPVPIDPKPTLDFLPNLNETSLKYYRIKDCVLPVKTIDAIWTPLGVQSLEELVIESTTFENNTLNNYYLKIISKHLLHLTLSDAQLERIDEEVFLGLKNLKSLDLTDNRLIIEENHFTHLHNLLKLRLQNNKITNIPENAFQGLVNLQILDLNYNLISNLKSDTFKDLRNIRALDLSRNKLRSIPEDLFTTMVKLETVIIERNEISQISLQLFNNNPMLRNIITSDSNLTALPDTTFSNFNHLELVYLSKCMLKNVSHTLFQNSSNLEMIHLDGNSIETIPENLLHGLHKLRELRLSGNKLETLPTHFLKDSVDLVELRLNGNKFEIIPETVFQNCTELEVLYLNDNDIKKLGLNVFRNNRKLKFLDLSKNYLSIEFGAGSPFAYAPNLENLNLASNRISFLHEDFKYKTNLNTLNLDNNLISSINYRQLPNQSPEIDIFLRSNLINIIDLSWVEDLVNDNVLTLFVEDNPIICDCRNYDLFRYFNLSIKPLVHYHLHIEADNLLCAEPEDYKEIEVVRVDPKDVTCRVEECPDPCDCFYEPHNIQFIIDCSSRRLLTIPVLKRKPKDVHFNSIAVYLHNNSLVKGPSKGQGYDGIDVLNLSNNKIKRLVWIPDDLKELNIEGNYITSLGADVINKLNITNAFLRNNPWSCDCDVSFLMDYLKNNLVPFKKEIKCAESGRQIHNLHEDDVCASNKFMQLSIIIIVLSLVTIAALILLLYNKYTTEIKAWLYAHSMCLWFVTESDVDSEKTFDAFISYSHADEEFVIGELVTKLEGGPKPFKLCVHIRDWMPGELITSQVTQSIKNSRRTIVVLTANFLKSIWGALEFRAARVQSLLHNKSRVIIIMYGDIDLESIRDEDLKSYLRTNTYIKWGDPWFWHKLQYALPHK